MAIKMIVLGILQIATIYLTTFRQFLAVRNLFGLSMGGVYGDARPVLPSRSIPSHPSLQTRKAAAT